jgi:hypothetical protein
LRDSLQEIKQIELDFPQFFTRFHIIKQIYSTPTLEEIKNFNIATLINLDSSELSQERNLHPEFKSWLKNKENGNLIEDFLAEGNSGYFKFYIHELYLLDFPKYFIYIDSVWKAVMINDANLVGNVKYYLAIMVRKHLYYIILLIIKAASVSKSYYLLKFMEFMFIVSDGDESWLIKGLKATPMKIQILSAFLNKLAHACWTITTDDITYIQSANCWNYKELIQVVSIYLLMQRISTMSESFGLSSGTYNSNELVYTDFGNETTKHVDKSDIIKLFEIDKNKTLSLKKRLDEINSESSKESVRDKGSPLFSSVKTMRKSHLFGSLPIDESIHKKIRKASTEDFFIKTEVQYSFTSNNDVDSEIQKEVENSNIFLKHLDSNNTRYYDFDQRIFNYESYLDFNWNDQAFYILKEITPRVIEMFHKETEYAFEMTSNTLGHIKDIDTKQIRFAIWCYIEKIYGLERENYSYSIVNKLLYKEEKTFVKNCVCHPELITHSSLNTLAFSCLELVHIVIIASASKLRTQLTFFTSRLHEIMNES